MDFKRRDVLMLIAGILLGTIIGVLLMVMTRQTAPTPIVIEPPPPTQTPFPTPSPAPVRVFVNGEVNQPDVYALPADGILQDAIEAAGGFTNQANQSVVNLALPVQDGLQLFVPAIGQPAPTPVSVPLSSPSNPPSANALININTATAEQLDGLPGIGPTTAGYIITYREENGLFESIEEIINVKNIGNTTFNRIKPLITIE